MSKSATKEGTTRYAQKFARRAAEGHFRETQRLVLSSLGIGTYLGQPDTKTDEGYRAAAVAAVESGINVIDAAINYRFQRSERSIGEALRHLAAKGFPREEIVLCTKGGYLTPDGSMPADSNEYFFREYIQPGVFTAKDIAAGSHCMTPKFLKNQLGRSLKNLGVECVDVYYLHNPETQLSEVPKEEFLNRIREAFTFLESAVEAGEAAGAEEAASQAHCYGTPASAGADGYQPGVELRLRVRLVRQRPAAEMPDGDRRMDQGRPRNRGRRPHPLSPSDRGAVASRQRARCSALPAFRQWSRVRLARIADLDHEHGHRHGIDRSRQALAEWRDGEFQWQIPRRVPEPGVVSLAGRGQGRDRDLAPAF